MFNTIIKKLVLALAFLLPAACHAQPGVNQILLEETQTSIPFELQDNRIFITIFISGKPFHFVLDTGGGIVLEKETAQTLDLNPVPAGDITGAGKDPVPSWRAKVDTIAMGAIRIINKEAIVLSLREIKEALHLKYLDGIIGYEIFQRFITEINYADSTVTFYEKDHFNPGSGFEAIPFWIHNGRIPVLKLLVDGREAEMIVDTGDRSSLSLFGPFAEQEKLREKYVLGDTLVTGYGLGGPIYAQLLTIGELEINGNLKLQDIITRIPTIRSGAFYRNDRIKGSIGNGLLKRFKRVVFNYFDKEILIWK